MWSPPFPPEEFDGYDDEMGMDSEVRSRTRARLACQVVSIIDSTSNQQHKEATSH